MVVKTTSWFFSIFRPTLKGDFFNCLRWKLHKKGQLKIQQMAFMLMAVTLFFVLAGMFILIFKFSELKDESAALEEKNALLLVTKLANSPEFSCEGSFGEQRVNCIDADKVLMLKGNIDKYSDFWGVVKIEIRKVYPVSKTVECNPSNFPDCNFISVLSKNLNALPASSNYVALCMKSLSDQEIYDKCELALLMVSAEDKR